MRKILLLLVFLVPGWAFGQGSTFHDIALTRTGRPLPNATVRVCTAVSGNPCTLLATVYTDYTLGVVSNNPGSTDQSGNYQFYLSPGKYHIQESAAGGLFKEYDLVVPIDPFQQNAACSAGTFITQINLTGPPTCTIAVYGNGVVNVKAPPYNADSTFTTDATTAIQNAINATVSAGGKLLIPAGNYKIATGPLTISGRLFLEGQSTDLATGSVFNSTSTTGDILQINQGAQGTKVHHMAFVVTGTPTAGAAIDINLTSSIDGTGASPVEIFDCAANNIWNGILNQNGNQTIITRFTTGAPLNDSIKISGGLAIFVTLSNFYGSAANGIEVSGSGAGMWLTDVQIKNGLHGITQSAGGQVFGKGVVVDTPSGTGWVVSTGGGQMECVDCWVAGSSNGYGYDFSNTTGFRILGGLVRANFLSGIHIQATATNISVLGAVISDNGHSNGTHQKGVLVDAGASFFAISNNLCGADNGDTVGEQTTCVLVSTGASDHYIITNNLNTDPANQTIVTDNGTGTHKTVTGNI